MGPARARLLAYAALVAALFGCSAAPFSRPAGNPGGPWASSSRSDPALSGDGKLLASLIEEGGRKQLLLQDPASGQRLPLRHFGGRLQPESPSLSWSGRYLAAVVQQGAQRRVQLEDRLSGRLLTWPLPGGGQPERLSLSPDASRLAVQLGRDGQWQVQLFDLEGLLEPDLAGGVRIRGAETSAP
jgi:Tol biopolymer transport system component